MRFVLLSALALSSVCLRAEVIFGFEVNTDESKVGAYALEDPLTFADGRPVRSTADWPARRREILDLFAREMYGQPPPEPQAVAVEVLEEGETLSGFAVRRQVRMWFTPDKSGPCLDWLMIVPKHAQKPVPVIMGLNYYGNHSLLPDREIVLSDGWLTTCREMGVSGHRPSEGSRGIRCAQDSPSIFPAGMVVSRGYALVTACYGQAAPDPAKYDEDPITKGDFALVYTNGLFRLWGTRNPERTDDVTAFGAWAWALSRGLDLAERTPELDARRCVVTGCSRLGKAALLAAARDERFAVCAPCEAGAGGVQLLKRNFGETVKIINEAFPHWFCRAYRKYSGNEQAMPFDQHLLLATVAPRPLLVLGFDDPWYDTRGEYLSLKAAEPVWRLLTDERFVLDAFPSAYDTSCIGVRLGYVHRTGRHGLSIYDWTWLLSFADRALSMRK